MNHFLSDRINKLSTSQTLAMAALARELKLQGKDIISLSLGEPDFNTPDFVKEAAKKAIDENYSTYTPVDGYADLKDAICRKFKRDNNLEYKPANIVVSTGAKQSLYNIAQVMLNDGDEVILPAPYWVSYKEIVQFAEGVVVEIPTTHQMDFKITPELLEKAITPKTKMFIFSNPCNPTGTLYSKDELEKLKNVFAKHPHVLILSDEIYEHISFEGKMTSLGSFPEIFNQIITVNGLSKGFAMTGWRLGYMAGPTDIIKSCVKMQGQFTSATSSITQRAAIAALKSDPKDLIPMRDEFLKRRDYLISLMEKIPGIELNHPGGAFYLFPKVSSFYGKKFKDQVIKDSKDMCLFLLAEGHVALTPGFAFGAPEYIRLSYATSLTQIEEAVKRIDRTLKLLH